MTDRESPADAVPTMKRYRLAIFDFDGTLADSINWFRNSFQETVTRFNLKPTTPEELEVMRGLSAREIMARGVHYANHLGLFAEELSLRAEPLGNFPQALTHLAFVSAAYYLDRQLSDPDGRVWQP